MSKFKLFPEEAHWWSFNDYQKVLDTMTGLKPKRVLEFGPGSSTLALIEGGAESVDACEDKPDWAEVWEKRLARRFPEAGFPTVVRLHRFTWPEGEPLAIPAVDGQRFDLDLIDGPTGTERRPDVLRYALERCTWVLMPTEEWKTRAVLRPLIQAIAKEAGRPVEITETGPLGGAFALIGPKPAKAPTKAKTPKAPKAPRAKEARVDKHASRASRKANY